MKPDNKKYFSISEVSKITGCPAYKLRYLEKSKSGIEITQIRNRRYYTAEDINLIKQQCKPDDLVQLNLFTPQYKDNTLNFVIKIDSLISKLTTLEENIKSAIAF